MRILLLSLVLASTLAAFGKHPNVVYVLADEKLLRPFTIHHSINGSFAIRKGKWKLCLCPGSGGWSAPRPNVALKNNSLPLVQLFDLESDPAEKNNLQGKHPDIVKELVADLAKAIHDGRTNKGSKQANDGHPNTFHAKVLAAYPALKQ